MTFNKIVIFVLILLLLLFLFLFSRKVIIKEGATTNKLIDDMKWGETNGKVELLNNGYIKLTFDDETKGDGNTPNYYVNFNDDFKIGYFVVGGGGSGADNNIDSAGNGTPGGGGGGGGISYCTLAESDFKVKAGEKYDITVGKSNSYNNESVK